MARVWRQSRPVRMRDDEYVEVVERDESTSLERTTSVIARIIDTIAAILTGVLALRFILSLFGANPANGFANFIYSVTEPLVRPFVGLFGTSPTLGAARIEFETIIAIIVYGVIAMILARLVSIPLRNREY